MANSTIHAETIIKNANIISMNPSQPRAESLAIWSDKLIAVGTNDEIDGLRGSQTNILDLSGSTVVPGFIDAHIHVLYSGIRHVMQEDCALDSTEAIIAALKLRSQNTPAGEWVMGFKFDDTKTIENRFLTRHDLDIVSTEHPVMVAHRAGHDMMLNSLGLKLAGYSRESTDPPGGRIGRDPNTGEPNGILYERATDRIKNDLLPAVTSTNRRRGLEVICKMLNEAGLTSAHDAMVDTEQLKTYQEGRKSGDLTIRTYMLMLKDYFEDMRNAGITSGFGDDMLKIGGIKLVSDGAIGSRTAFLSKPYIGSPCDHGIRAMDPEETQHWVSRIHEAGFQVCTHSNGDAAIDMVLTAYEKALKENPNADARLRLEHCTVVNPGLLRRIKAAGCVTTPFCTYVYYHGEKMPFYGEERLQWMFAQRSFIDYGINSTGATDYPPGPFEPLLGIQSCVTRTDYAGRSWGLNQRISVEEALKVYTINGAFASFEEDIKGSIEAGKLADLVILSEDPTAVDSSTIKDIQIEKTIVGGRTVYEA